MKQKHAFIAVAVLSLCWLSLPAIHAADAVDVRTEDRIVQFVGDITEETYKSIKLLMEEEGGNKVPRDIPVESPKFTIVRVDHSPKPYKYAEAYQKYVARDYAGAFTTFAESYRDDFKDNPWVGPYIRYYAAEAAFREAKYNQFTDKGKKEWYGKAEAQYGKLLTEASKHRLAPDARIGQVKSQMRLDMFDAARTNLSAIAASDYPTWTREEGAVWSACLAVEEGNYHKARGAKALREKQDDAARAEFAAANKKYDEALGALDTVIAKMKEAQPSLAYLAMLSKAYAYQGKEKYADAEKTFEIVGILAPDEEIRAEAFNSRGLSLRARGQPREALFSFLRVVVLHFGIPSEHEKALYHAAWSAREYYEKDMRRAIELARTCKTRYPNGVWTKKLTEEGWPL